MIMWSVLRKYLFYFDLTKSRMLSMKIRMLEVVQMGCRSNGGWWLLNFSMIVKKKYFSCLPFLNQSLEWELNWKNAICINRCAALDFFKSNIQSKQLMFTVLEQIFEEKFRISDWKRFLSNCWWTAKICKHF